MLLSIKSKGTQEIKTRGIKLPVNGNEIIINSPERILKR
jgi:hypothetical protein